MAETRGSPGQAGWLLLASAPLYLVAVVMLVAGAFGNTAFIGVGGAFLGSGTVFLVLGLSAWQEQDKSGGSAEGSDQTR